MCYKLGKKSSTNGKVPGIKPDPYQFLGDTNRGVSRKWKSEI